MYAPSELISLGYMAHLQSHTTQLQSLGTPVLISFAQ